VGRCSVDVVLDASAPLLRMVPTRNDVVKKRMKRMERMERN
jgi:hypothetical protein